MLFQLCGKKGRWDFPGGTVDENLPANAGNMGSIPGLGRFHITAEQLSPCTTTPGSVL